MALPYTGRPCRRCSLSAPVASWWSGSPGGRGRMPRATAGRPWRRRFERLPARGAGFLGHDHRLRVGDGRGDAGQGRRPRCRGAGLRSPVRRHRRRAALHLASRMRLRRLLGVPLLFAVAYSAVGFSIYFSIGVVADRGLGLTPVIFLAAGLMFVLTTLSYVEAGAMFRERGGSSTFARYAFNELVSFVAGWAILIDYVIVVAAAAISVPHYLTPVSDSFAGGSAEVAVAAAVIGLTAVLNIAGITGRSRQLRLVVVALADLALLL